MLHHEAAEIFVEAVSGVSIALFSAIGLLVSLVAILLGAPGVWY
jgi:hypothetical protein